jgi:EmrB/QacA subfamily drug resistance transporter
MVKTGESNRWWLVAAAGLVVFMAALDSTAVNVALPAIERDLGTRTSVTQWVVLGYLLPLIALALPAGRWLDRVGKRAALVFSVAGFAASSMAAGLALDIGWLIAARIVQGAFGAILFALAAVLATIAVRPHARGRAMGVVTTVGPLGGILGPALGGFLVESVGWEWIFYLNVPVSIVVIATGLAQIPAGGGLRLPARTWASEAALLGGAVVIVILALSLTASRGIAWITLPVLAVPLLLAWRRMETSRPVRELMRRPGMAGPHLALLAIAAAAGFVMFLTPFYLQRVLHVSASNAGLTMLPFPMAMALLGLIGGALADRWGARRIAVTGAIGLTGALLLIAPLGERWAPGDLAWRLALLGVAMGLFNAPNMALALSRAPRDLLGTTGASTSLARQLGFALGPALATTIWALSGYAVNGMRAGIGLAAAVSALGAVALIRERDSSPGRSLFERRNDKAA